jgi:signal transduction histidine kinase
LIEDTTQEPDWVFVPGLEWVRSDVIAPLILEGQVIGIVNMFNDKPRAFSQEIADRIMAFAVPAAIAIHNARLYATEQRARQVAEILSATSLALAQSLDTDVVLDKVLEHTQHLIPYDAAGVALLGDGYSLTVRAGRGSKDLPAPLELLNHAFISQEWPHIQAVIETGDALLIPDTLEFPGWKSFFGKNARNWLGIPLVFDENTIGILMLVKTKTHFFTQEHIQLAEILVSQASVAIQNAWLFEQVRAGHERLQSLSRRLVEVQESERRYIARELHDETSQALTALMFGLRLMEQEVHRPENLLARLAELKQLTDGVLEDLHRLAMDLRPASLDHLGLVAALEQLIKVTCERYTLAVRFKTVGLSAGDRLAEDIETTLYRIVQEALTNAVRHAKAGNVDVILELRDGKSIVVVEDDGVGFDTNDIRKSGHLGMLGMQERAQMAGGTLQIESRPGGGTTIVAEVPYVYSHLNR